VDNLCHTLTGAACGEAGLKRLTRFGTPVLLIASNLPDIDVLGFAANTPAVALRRGWTHGVAAQALLPVLLTGLVLLYDHLRPPPAGAPRARAAPVLLLSYVGVLSHVGMDWLNSYGVRLLKPLSERWFYGDAVFIIDPWLWLMLGLGVLLARRQRRPVAALVAILAAIVYITAMVLTARMSRQHVVEIWTERHGRAPRELMVGPMPVTPLRRQVIIDTGDEYFTGRYHVRQGTLALDERPTPRNEDAPAAVRAREHERVRAVLIWARFPFYHLSPTDGGTTVALGDMRFPARVGGINVFVPDE